MGQRSDENKLQYSEDEKRRWDDRSDEYKQGKYVLEPWFEAMSDSHRQAVREYLGWHLLVKASVPNQKRHNGKAVSH